MHQIQSVSGGYPAELCFASPQQTAGASHLGRDVTIISQPVMLQLEDVSPPPYSEIVHTPPPSYLDATGQNACPQEVEVVSVSAQRGVGYPSADPSNCLDGEKKVLGFCGAGLCVACLVCAVFS